MTDETWGLIPSISPDLEWVFAFCSLAAETRHELIDPPGETSLWRVTISKAALANAYFIFYYNI